MAGGVWSLRKRLVLSVAALIAAACIVIGVVLPLILHAYLVAGVDEQLRSASERVVRLDDHGHGQGDKAPDGDDPGMPSQSPSGLLQPGQQVGTIAALSENGNLIACGWLDDDGDAVICPADVVDQLASITSPTGPRTLDLHHVGDYRVIAVETADGLFITGLPLRAAAKTVTQLVVIELAVSAVVLALAAAVSAGVIGRMLAPLRRVAATATRVSDLPLDRGEVHLAERVSETDADPRTEVGQVGHAINQMLTHVEQSLDARQQSEQRVRSFVADASHELRTPLASIRGYAELTRRAKAEIPPDIAHALSRVESESVRMSALVEDLLLLARLDSGRPLDREPVDLSALIIDAVSDAHAAGRDHTWRLDLPDDAVEVIGDRARLHQVIANLLANARTHTPAGTTVLTSLRPSDDEHPTTIEVCDDGPGIPDALLPTVFDRFARGDSSRSRTKGSTGLGLAIVSAVVASHRGTVTVESKPGRTVFRVSLPADGPEPGGRTGAQ